MLEDFWLPRREGGRGTEITTLAGGSNLGEIDDITYFKQKLFRSLNVPISRLEAEAGFSLGRSTEITRDELKFTKFVQRLRKKFTPLFTDILKTQLNIEAYIGTFFSKEWVQKNVLNLTDHEIEEMQSQINKESNSEVEDGGVDTPDDGNGINRNDGGENPPEDNGEQ